jgi:hypothetical protein
MSLKKKLTKIGAKVISNGRYVTFQIAEVAVPKALVVDIPQLIAELRPPPDPARAGGARLLCIRSRTKGGRVSMTTKSAFLALDDPSSPTLA